jgi:hypothetical protein
MATLIKKCANPTCADIIGRLERPNKKFCSQECKTRYHNDNSKKGVVTWEKILDNYKDLPSEPFIPFPKWLKENYYPPRVIKQKKITL